MKYLGVYSKDEDLYKKVRELTDSDYNEYTKTVKRIYDINEVLSLLSGVRGNYVAYMELMKHYTAVSMSSEQIDGVTTDQMLGNVNLHIMNYLSSVKTFLQHSEFNLKKKYGKNSQRFKSFKNATNHAFDTCFSYRFLYHLRNYVQHCGMPVAGFDEPKIIHNDKINKRFTFFLVAYCDRDELLRKYDKWHETLLKEIPKLPDRIDISPHIYHMMICINHISRIIIKNDLPELLDRTRFLIKLMNPVIRDTSPLENLNYPLNIDIPFICESDDLHEGIIFNVEWFPIHLIQTILYVNKNFR